MPFFRPTPILAGMLLLAQSASVALAAQPSTVSCLNDELEIQQLRSELEAKNKTMSGLMISQSQVRSLESLSTQAQGRAGGNHNAGVFRVFLNDGTSKILKIAKIDGNASNRPTTDMARSIVLQNRLARLGFSPQVHAVLTQKELSALALRLSPVEMAELTEPRVGIRWVGLVMDEVPQGFNLLKDRGPLQVRPLWSKSEILNRLRAVGEALKRLHIHDMDFQVLLDKNGLPWVIDLDQAKFKPNAKIDDYINADIRIMSSRIEKAFPH